MRLGGDEARCHAGGMRVWFPTRVATARTVVAGLILVGACQGQVLFDGAVGTPPTQQGWTFLALPSLATPGFADGAATLDTRVSSAIAAGWSRLAPVPLRRTPGFRVEWEFQLLAESHANANRAGLSFIVLAEDRKGLEIGVWMDRVWAQGDQPLFVQAEGAEVNLALGWQSLVLTVQGDRYTVDVNGASAFGGAVRDYSAFVGAFDPYETPNFLFVGDDTTSAQGAFRLRKVVLGEVTVEVPALGIRRLESGGLELGWRVESGGPGRVVESSGVSVEGPWEVVGGIPEQVGGEWRLTVSVGGEARFFRLR